LGFTTIPSNDCVFKAFSLVYDRVGDVDRLSSRVRGLGLVAQSKKYRSGASAMDMSFFTVSIKA
jgi:hypothetical protein